jgi:hypothetical protein
VRAESIGYSNNLYNVDDSMFPTRGVRAVDDVWSSYESALPGALDRLIERSTSAHEWINILVPFVAATFARDRGYKYRVESRIGGRFESDAHSTDLDLRDVILDETNIAMNRVLEMERFAVRALASEWVVCELDDDVVLSDVGYGFDLVSENPDTVALMLPIGRRHLLVLTPCARTRIFDRSDDRWIPVITYVSDQAIVSRLNQELAKTAQDFVIGTLSAIESVDSARIGTFSWEGIDTILAAWPFNVDTRSLGGLYQVVRALVQREIDSPYEVLLNRYAALSNLEPEALFLFPRREVFAHHYLNMTETELVLTVDFPNQDRAFH